MAKGIDIIGNLKGKRGGVVYYRANGEQISRAKVTPKNPKSAKQAVQRMVLATAAKMAAAYGPIVDHSFEGVPVGRKSLQYFRRQAMAALRSAAAAYLNDPTATSVPADFALKGSPIVGALQGLTISRGSLPINTFIAEPMGDIAESLVMDTAAVMTPALPAIATQAEYERQLALMGLKPGDQLTIVYLLDNPDVPVASFAHDGVTEQDFQQVVRFARIVFKPTVPEVGGNLVTENATSGGLFFDPAFIAESAGNFPEFKSGGDIGPRMAFITPAAAPWRFVCGTIIRSQKQEDGNYLYSTSQMVSTEETFDSNDAWPVYLSYMAGAEAINVGSELYLHHAVAAEIVD